MTGSLKRAQPGAGSSTALATPRGSYCMDQQQHPPGQCRSLLEVAQLTPSVTAHAHYSLLAAHFPPKPALRSSLHWNLLVCTRCIAPGVMQNCVHLPPVPPRIQKYQVSSEFPLLPTLSHWKAPSGRSEDGCKYHGREFEASIKPPRFPHVSPALTQKVQ